MICLQSLPLVERYHRIKELVQLCYKMMSWGEIMFRTSEFLYVMLKSHVINDKEYIWSRKTQHPSGIILDSQHLELLYELDVC